MTHHPPQFESSPHVRRVTVCGLIVDLALTIFKIAIGIFSSSLALIMDGVHSVLDAITDFLILIGPRFWSAPPDDSHPHGHGRMETLATAAIGFIVLGTGVGLAYQAVSAIPTSVGIKASGAVFIVAVASILSKEVLFRWTISVGERHRSSALVANAWNHRSDAYSSIPVVVAVIGSWIRPDWTFLDPVAAILVGLLVAQAAKGIIWPALKELVDTAPSQDTRAALRDIVLSTEGVRGTHALRVRRVGPGLHVDLHIQVDPEISVHAGHEIAHDAKRRLLECGHHVADVIVHVEPDEQS